MPIIISALHFAWSDMPDCFRVVRGELGLDGVELSLATSFSRPHCTREDLALLPGLKAEYGLAVAAHIWEDLAQLGVEQGSAALRGWLEISARAGIEGLVLHGGSYPDRQEGLRRTEETIAAVIDDFAAAGVTLLLENHYPYDYKHCEELYSEPWEFQQLLAAVPSPALRFCFDTGHAHMNRNGEAMLTALAPYIRHIHLADNGGIDDDHRPYRCGTVPWDSYLGQIRDLQIDATWCVEFPVREDWAPFRQCVAELNALEASGQK